MRSDIRIDRRRTAAAELATGKFWCTSSAHMAKGDPVIVHGRKVCAACAAKRNKVIKEKTRG